MADTLELVIDDLVAANRILSNENIVDAYGHISVRHPDNPNRFLLSRARAPECIEADDIMEFTLGWRAGRRQGPGALSRTLYPRRDLRGAAGGAVGRA